MGTIQVTMTTMVIIVMTTMEQISPSTITVTVKCFQIETGIKMVLRKPQILTIKVVMLINIIMKLLQHHHLLTRMILLLQEILHPFPMSKPTTISLTLNKMLIMVTFVLLYCTYACDGGLDFCSLLGHVSIL